MLFARAGGYQRELRAAGTLEAAVNGAVDQLGRRGVRRHGHGALLLRT